ncbi:MAG: membrane-bound lytic murein transglycosylase MltF [Halofilum sp. (in: g-proteobacteria)]|nr:membrane-bound lytic murein transglycosylase MltF [Halofilum sp. (in: g-proteobacteria)]
MIALVAAVGLAGPPGFGAADARARSLEAIQASGSLVVLTRNAPTTWYIGREDRPTGPEYELVEAFADYLGVEAEYVLKDTVDQILVAIERGEADLAAAGLTITRERRQRYRFGPPYQSVTQQVVCRRGGPQPEDLRELAELRIAVIANSSYAELLRSLELEGYRTPEWTALEGVTTEELLRRVWERKLPCTVADSTIVDINRRYFPELVTPMRLSREQQLGWVMPGESRDLDAAVTRWLHGFRNSGRLETLQEKYYGFFEKFDYVDTRRMMRRVNERLPRYLDWFRDASADHGFSWTLLAAQGYQESHWNPRAESPTGVRGIMMLTRNTAEALGVTNRLDPRQSIYGGAHYLARMKDRFADRVVEPDRTWLALAAYNVGRAHMHDAQILARRKGLSPYHWRDIKRVLPLLASPEYYRKLKYGYARGHEPVRYVQRIREYHHILSSAVKPPMAAYDWGLMPVLANTDDRR